MAIRDISKIQPENIRTTPVPLKIESIKEYFENKQLFFVIDYANSQVKGNMFLTYIANLDLPCEIQLDGTPAEEKLALLKNYMESRNLAHSDALRLACARTILAYRGASTGGFYPNPVLSPEEEARFIAENGELLRRWDQFLSSTLLYLLGSFPDLEKEVRVREQFTTHEDPAFIGSNVVHLFGIPSFTERFFSAPSREPLLYFKPQFEEYMFRGKNLFHYFFVPENTLALAMNGMIAGAISPENLVALVNDLQGAST